MNPLLAKILKVVAILGGGMLVLRLFGPKLSGRMDRMMEEAPDDFPPKWMYLNITAIRENTERILETLDKDEAESESAVA